MTQQASVQDNIVITVIDAHSPIGVSMPLTAAAIRADASGFHEHPDYLPIQQDDMENYLISAGMDLSISDCSWQRLLQLVEAPFHAAITASGLERRQMDRGGILFALPNADPVIQETGLQTFFLDRFLKHFSLPAKMSVSGVQMGAAGVIFLLDKARDMLLGGERDFIFIVAIDSFMIDGRLSYYDEQWRLKSDRSPMGFTPGEAAAILLIETEAQAKARQQDTLIQLGGIGIGQEVNTINGDKSSSGEGLSHAIEDALSDGLQQSINWIYSDLNGESYRAYEWGVVSARLGTIFSSQLAHIHPADVLGDVGSATSAIQLGCIGHAFQNQYATDHMAFLFATNDNGQRVALSVLRPEN